MTEYIQLQLEIEKPDFIPTTKEKQEPNVVVISNEDSNPFEVDFSIQLT